MLQSDQKKAFYLTTTLPYMNAALHIGHALEFVRADAVARLRMLKGDDVFFNTGTDEHGQKIYTKALESGKDPQSFVDEAYAVFRNQVQAFGVTDAVHFVRTTDAHHVAAAQEFWRRVDKNGYIYKKTYQAKYCVGCEEEKSESQLENGKCPLHPSLELEIINEENYFFKLSAFQDKLLALYESNPNLVIPAFRYNELKEFVARGLEDFSISRLKEKMSWGIPVPGDDTQVIYVWFDALINYISTLGWPEDEATFTKYWVEGTPTQYCGKDNTRFQGLTWQAMLMAAGFPNTHKIVINGFIVGEGGVRMSKSLGNVVDPYEVAQEYGTDALRLFLLKEISNFEDSPFTMERFKEAYNANLANGIGNLASRILTLSEKYLAACPPIPEQSIPQHFFDLFDAYDLQGAANYVWKEIQDLDKYIQETEAFKVIKTDEAKGRELITEYVLRLYTIARMLNPLMPSTNATLKQLIRDNKKPETPLFARLP